MKNARMLGCIGSVFLVLSGVVVPADSFGGDELAAHPALRIEAGGGWGGRNFETFTGREFSQSGGVFRGAGSATQRIESFALQIDVNGSNEDLALDSFSFSPINYSSVGGGAHLNWRDEQIGMVGVEGGYQSADFGLTQSANRFRVGLEAEAYLSDWTVGLSGGYLNIENLFSNGFNTFVSRSHLGYGHAHVRYYVGENFKIELGGSAIPGDRVDQYFVNANAEYKFDELPVALFVRWNGTFIDNQPAVTTLTDAQQAMAGFKLYFGGKGDTIRHYERAYFADSCLMQASVNGFC